jgi:hypothetical protein
MTKDGPRCFILISLVNRSQMGGVELVIHEGGSHMPKRYKRQGKALNDSLKIIHI